MAENPARFGKFGNRVRLEGTVGGGTDLTVFVLPKGYRPETETHFHVESAAGTSVVTVMPDGSVLADPSVGWVKLDGIEFTAVD